MDPVANLKEQLEIAARILENENYFEDESERLAELIVALDYLVLSVFVALAALVQVTAP